MSEAELPARLRAYLDGARRDSRAFDILSEAADFITASLAREWEMRRALEPFATRCENAELLANSTGKQHGHSVNVPLDDLRRARDALASPAPGPSAACNSIPRNVHDGKEESGALAEAVTALCTALALMDRKGAELPPEIRHQCDRLRKVSAIASPAPSSGEIKPLTGNVKDCFREHGELSEENVRLRRALQRIADLVDSEDGEPLDDAIRIANRALTAPSSGEEKSCFECGHDLNGPYCPKCNPDHGPSAAERNIPRNVQAGNEDGALLPCPFCGGKAEQFEPDDDANFGGSCITCTVCNASSAVHFDRKENLEDSWNSRAAPLSTEARYSVSREAADEQK